MKKNNIFKRLVSLTTAVAMVMTISATVFAGSLGNLTLDTAKTYRTNKTVEDVTDYYTFTPTVSGRYKLSAYRTNGSGRGTVQVSESSGFATTIAVNSFGGSGGSTTPNLTAGQTYYFRVGRETGSSYATFSMTLTANYNVTINFNANGGEGTMASIGANRNQNKTLPTCTFTRENYTFAGWATSPTGQVSYQDGGTIRPSANTINLYAVWTPATATINFHANHGSGTMGSITATIGQETTLPQCTFTRTNYTFSGWATSETGSLVYPDKGSITPNAATIDLYAVWTENATIRFRGGYGASGSMDNISIPVGQATNLPTCTFTRSGYQFAGWATNQYISTVAYADGDPITPGPGTTTLYAVWRQVYTATFNANAQDATGTIDPITRTTPGNITLPSEGFTRTGYGLRGWSTSAWGTSRRDPGSTYNLQSSTTFYAVWGPQLSYDANGGEGAIATQTYANNAQVDLKTASDGITRANYTLIGWSTNPNATEAEYALGQRIRITAPMTLYAVWGRNVSFASNGATETLDPVYAVEGTSITLPSGGLTRDGYTLAGWSVRSDGTTKDYGLGESYTVRGNVTLTAVWECTLSFDANGGTGDTMDDITVIAGATVNLPACTYEYTTYSFAGWADTTTGTPSMTYTPSASTVMYAIWTARTVYNVNFDANGGEGTMASIPLTDDVTGTIPACEFTYTGFTFLGWATDPESTTVDYAKGDPIVVVDSDVTLYALWSARDVYYVNFDANGGEGTMSPLALTDDVTGTIPACGFTRDGYTCIGWAVDADSETADYVQGDSIRLTNDNLTLYAVWEEGVTPGPDDPDDPDDPEVPDEPVYTPEQLREMNITHFVDRLYLVALGRAYDVDGRNNWANLLLVNGNSGSDIVYGFLNSQEFIGKNLSDEEYITILYRIFFDREPDAEGMANWKNALAGGATRNDILRGFADSPEWLAYCARYQVNP